MLFCLLFFAGAPCQWSMSFATGGAPGPTREGGSLVRLQAGWSEGLRSTGTPTAFPRHAPALHHLTANATGDRGDLRRRPGHAFSTDVILASRPEPRRTFAQNTRRTSKDPCEFRQCHNLQILRPTRTPARQSWRGQCRRDPRKARNQPAASAEGELPAAERRAK